MAEIQIFTFQSSDGSTIYTYYNEDTDGLRTFKGRPTRGSQVIPDGSDYPDNPNIGKASTYFRCVGADKVDFVGSAQTPYAVKRTTVGASICANGGCDLFIFYMHVTDEIVPGAEDGTMTVDAGGTYPGIEYSLDAVEWQTSPTFTNLSSGTYTIYARDSNNCGTQNTFTIAPGNPSAYGIRYRCIHDDLLSQNITVYIRQKSYAGAPEDICLGQVPEEIRWLGESRNAFAPIIGSECNLQLLSQSNEQFISLFTSDERQYKVEIYRNQFLLWTGYILPDVYNEPYSAAKYYVDVTATDGLGTLKDRPFLTSREKKYIGKYSALQIIIMCLSKLDLQLSIVESVNWYADGMVIDGEASPLTQLTKDVAEFYVGEEPADCAFVLQSILETFVAQIKQAGGEWHIVQPKWLEAPEQPIYPPIDFGVYNVFYGDQKGQASIADMSGGNPMDGTFMLSLDMGVYRNVSELPQIGNNNIVLLQLSPGTHSVRIRRGINDQYIKEVSLLIQMGFQLGDALYGDNQGQVSIFNVYGYQNIDNLFFSVNGTDWTSILALPYLGNSAWLYESLPHGAGVMRMRYMNDNTYIVQQPYIIP